MLTNGSRQNAFPHNWGDWQGRLPSPPSLNTALEAAASAIGQKKRKCTPIRKEEIKSSLFADYMTVWTELPRNLQKT